MQSNLSILIRRERLFDIFHSEGYWDVRDMRSWRSKYRHHGRQVAPRKRRIGRKQEQNFKKKNGRRF